MATIHIQLCKPPPVPATKPLCTVHPGVHRGSSPVAMQKHMAVFICKSNILLPVRKEPIYLMWEDRLWGCCCEVFITGLLLSCLIPYLTWLPNVWNITEGQDQVVPLSDCIGCYLRTSYCLLLHLLPGLVLFIKRKMSFPIALHRLFDDCHSPLIMFVVIFHFKDFLTLQFSPDGKQRQFFFMSQGRCRKHGTAI